MEEIKRKRQKEEEPNLREPRLYEPGRNVAIHSSSGKDQPNQAKPPLQMSHKEMTQGEWDTGTRSVSYDGNVELTGKLCRCMMALIRWKVGADVAVTDHVVQALEEWLCRRGISIYMDLL
jgi:hypothetical protein